MQNKTQRAAELRARASELAEEANRLPPSERRDLLVKSQALLDLAAVDEWIALPAHVAANHDYCLLPKIQVAPRRARRGKPGRKIRAASALVSGEGQNASQSDA